MAKGIASLLLGNVLMVAALSFILMYIDGAMGIFMALYIICSVIGFALSVLGFVQVCLASKKSKKEVGLKNNDDKETD